jgi:hypothetical protein
MLGRHKCIQLSHQYLNLDGSEVETAIKNLKIYKLPGIDKISAELT